MSRHRWCSFCTHSFREDELAEDEFGLPACPYCGAPGMYLRAWNAVRSLFPELPDEPIDGRRYHLGETVAEDEAQSIAETAAAGIPDPPTPTPL